MTKQIYALIWPNEKELRVSTRFANLPECGWFKPCTTRYDSRVGLVFAGEEERDHFFWKIGRRGASKETWRVVCSTQSTM